MELSLFNFKCFSEKIIKIDHNFSLLYGKSGSGKSTIFKAICYALEGKEKTNIKKYGQKTCKVILKIYKFLPIKSIEIIRTQSPNRLIVKVYNDFEKEYEDLEAQNIINLYINTDIFNIDGFNSLKEMENYIFIDINIFLKTEILLKEKKKDIQLQIEKNNIEKNVIENMIKDLEKYFEKYTKEFFKDIENLTEEIIRDNIEKNNSLLFKFKNDVKYNEIIQTIFNQKKNILDKLKANYNTNTKDLYESLEFNENILKYFIDILNKSYQNYINLKEAEIKLSTLYNKKYDYSLNTLQELFEFIQEYRKPTNQKNIEFYNNLNNLSEQQKYHCPSCGVECVIHNKDLISTCLLSFCAKFNIDEQILNNYIEIYNKNKNNIDNFSQYIQSLINTIEQDNFKIKTLKEEISKLKSVEIKIPDIILIEQKEFYNFCFFIQNIQKNYAKILTLTEICKQNDEEIQNNFNLAINVCTIFLKNLFYNKLQNKYMDETDVFNKITSLSHIYDDIKKLINFTQINNTLHEAELDGSDNGNLNEMITNLEFENKILYRKFEKLAQYKIFLEKKRNIIELREKLENYKKNIANFTNDIKDLSTFTTIALESILLQSTTFLEIFNTSINNILNYFFPKNKLYLNVQIFKEKKKSLSEYKINCVIFYENQICEYKNLSSGEKTRVDLACKISFLKIYNIKNNNKLNILLLDEKTVNIEKDLEFDIFKYIKENVDYSYSLSSSHDIINGIFNDIIEI